MDAPFSGWRGTTIFVALSLTGGRIRYPGLQRDVEDISLRLRATPDTVQVAEIGARSQGSRVRAAATVADYRTSPAVTADLEADLDLGDIGFFHPAAEQVSTSRTMSNIADDSASILLFTRILNFM